MEAHHSPVPKTVHRTIRSVLISPFIVLIYGYRYLISPLLGPRCRFEPSCSEYAAQSLTHFGLIRGSALTARRLCKCHPWHPGGYDPIPLTQHPSADKS